MPVRHRFDEIADSISQHTVSWQLSGFEVSLLVCRFSELITVWRCQEIEDCIVKSYLTVAIAASLLLAYSHLPVAAADEGKAAPLIKKGDELMDHRKYQQAVDTFREAIRLDPDNAKAHSRLGAALAVMHDIHETIGKSDLAKDDYATAVLEEQTAMKLNPKYGQPHIILGQIYANQQKLQDAIAEFKQALAIKSTFTANLDLGIAYLSAGDIDNAIGAFKEAERIKPTMPVPHMNLGLLYHAKGNRKEAIAEELKAIEADPKNHDAYINLGNIYLDSGDLDNAKENFERALHLAPGHPNAVSGLGWALAQKGFVKEGIEKQRQVIKTVPGFPLAHTRLAMLLAQQGKKEQAEAEFQAALKIAPKDISAGTEYAKFLAKNGQTEQAKAQYKKVLEIKPDFQEARQGLASLENAK
jgi:tetratricopeptide (TPR) repeat protein